jgi:hypothetical protein
MGVVPLTRRNVEEQIMLNLKALLVDTSKYEIMVGIPGGKINTKKAKQEARKTEAYKRASKIERKAILEKASQNVDIAYYAAQNEFGTQSEPRIPSRPFLRTTMERYKEKINKAVASILKELANNNKDAHFFMDKLGLFVAGMVKLNITDGNWTPNSFFYNIKEVKTQVQR